MKTPLDSLCFFLAPWLWHAEVPRPGIEPKPWHDSARSLICWVTRKLQLISSYWLSFHGMSPRPRPCLCIWWVSILDHVLSTRISVYILHAWHLLFLSSYDHCWNCLSRGLFLRILKKKIFILVFILDHGSL